MARPTDAQILAAHQYQYDGTHPNPNECTTNSMTMLLHLAAAQAGERIDLGARQFAQFLDRIPFRHLRFPAWFPGPGGATHPRAAQKGLEAMILTLRRMGLRFPWWPRRRSRQSPDDLGAALAAGWPTLIYGLGPTGIPHVVVPIERDAEGWLILDPGYPGQKQPMHWSEKQLANWWVNYGILYPAGTMINLVKEGE